MGTPRGGLAIIAENPADAAYGRFFEGHPASFARTLSVRVPAGAHAGREKFSEEAAIARVVELNEKLHTGIGVGHPLIPYRRPAFPAHLIENEEP